MAFLNKAQVDEYAARHGIDLSGMTWQQKQKAISAHMKENGTKASDAVVASRENDEVSELKRRLADAESRAAAVPQVPVVFERGLNVPEPTIEDYENVVLIASPEQRPTQYQRNKYYENVGTQKNTREISFDIGRNSPFGDSEGGTKSATYIVEETGRKVEAESTMPKYSALLTFRPTKDLVAVAEYGGHKGYLWTHHRLPNVRGLLDQMGAYDEFKDEWNRQPGRLFYLGGLLCCDISFTDSMMKRIQRELRKRGDE